MSYDVAVIGENLVDLFVSPDGATRAVVGGGPFNVARTIARLGGRVSFVSGVSDDAFGLRIREAAQSDGVTLARLAPSHLPTTMAVVELSDGDARYHFHLSDTAAFVVDGVDDLRDVSALYVGTLGLVVAPIADLSESAVLRASADTLVVVDPNCRPSATVDRSAFVDRVFRMCPRVDLLKVSVDDLAFLAPGLEPRDAAQSLREAGAAVVVVTDGPRPVRALVGGDWCEIPVSPTTVVDTVGAGDSLVGSFIVWWLGQGLTRADLSRSEVVESALRAAVAVSRRTCMVRGAQPPRALQLEGEPEWAWLTPGSSTTP